MKSKELTVAEIKQRGYMPLWIISGDFEGWGVYNVVLEAAELPMDEYTIYSIRDYGIKWIAFSEKPQAKK